MNQSTPTQELQACDDASVAPTKPYHHGALHSALLRQAREIMETQGLEAVTLRAVARAAGVSHSAPKNPFGDLTGLLSDLAAIGWTELSTAQRAELGKGLDTPKQIVRAMGQVYIGFARNHPAMFTLMFRWERLDMQRPALHKAYQDARYTVFWAMAHILDPQSVGSTMPTPENFAQWQPPPDAGIVPAMLGAWSLVHGLSMLLLDHRLDELLGRIESDDALGVVLDAVITALPSWTKD